MGTTRGHGGYVAVGAESTYGTGVAPTHYLRANKLGLAVKPMLKPYADLQVYGDAFGNARELYEERREVGGSLEMYLSYDAGCTLLLQSCMGEVVDGGSGPSSWTHTYTLNRDGGASLSIIQIEGQAGPTENAERFLGVKPNSWSLEWQVGQPAMLRLEDLIGQDADAMTTAPASPTFFSAITRSLFNHVAAVSFAGSSVLPLTSLKLRVNRGLSRIGELGSLLTAEPIQDAPGDDAITLELGFRHTSNALYTALLAHTVGAVAITVTGPNGTSLTVAAAVAQVVEAPKSTDGPGIVTRTAKLRILHDDLTIVVTNSEENYDQAAA